MVANKKCSECGGDMKKGFHSAGFWVSGEQPKLSRWTMFQGRNKAWVIAWKCRNCKFVKLYSEE